MYFAQHYLECLSQASYLIADESTRRAVVVDPRRDIEVYLDDAREHGFTIEGIINTHFHADFLSGHLELAKATGAWIGYGDKASPEFEFRPLADGERISLGDVTLEIMHTPGHTPEHLTYLVTDGAFAHEPGYALTGDFVFSGDVGRPDLLDEAAGMQDTRFAGALLTASGVRSRPVSVNSRAPWQSATSSTSGRTMHASCASAQVARSINSPASTPWRGETDGTRDRRS